MRKYIAEFIGTFLLTFIACGVASFTGGYQGFLGVVGIALIFGLTVTAMAYSIGNISGCHINPAVSLGFFISGKMSLIDLCGYVVSQLLGGIAAGFAMLGLSKTFNQEIIEQYGSYGYDLLSFGTNGYGEASPFLEVNMWGALIIEIILTFVFVITVIGVTSKEAYSKVAGVVIGLALTTVHLFGIPFTGTSVNPARSFGPAIAKGITGDVTALGQVWVFIAGPCIGAIIAAVTYMFLTASKAVATENKEISQEDTKQNMVQDEKEDDIKDIKKDMMQNEKRECIQDVEKDNTTTVIQDEHKGIKINGKEEIIQDIMNDLKNDVTQNKKEDTI